MRLLALVSYIILFVKCASPDKSSMNHMVVNKIALESNSSAEEVKDALDKYDVPFQPIQIQNWKEFPYKPSVQFRIAHNQKELFLQYKVREKYILAACDLNDDTCWPNNDSCVEFFLSPSADDNYTNFEFNCIGYCLFMKGDTKDRQRLPLNITEKIKRHSTLGAQTFSEKEGDFEWTLTIAIPAELITETNRNNLSGQTWLANFYKCGDHLKEKHYLSWSPISWPRPNFHLPDQFGEITFE